MSNHRAVARIVSELWLHFTHWLRQCDAIQHTRLLHRLLMVQRSAARIILQIQWGDRQSMSKVLKQLHWLPVKKHRAQAISLCTLCALGRHTGVPHLAAVSSYTTLLPTLCQQSTSARSTCQTSNSSRRAFACADPTLWNILLATPQNTGNRAQFKLTSMF